MGIFSKFSDFLTGGSNKRADAGSMPYSGYRPPRSNYLRPVEDQITKILMERSKGLDVGYDPKRREELLENFDIEQGRDSKERNTDIQNRISGMGLSRNPAVYDELLGRANRHDEEEKNLYRNRVDIEDLGVRNSEKREATAGLQDLNSQNFNQENAAADFDLRAFAQDSSNALAWENYRQSPIGTALQVAGAASKFFPGGGGGEPIGTTKSGAPSQTTVPSAGAYSKPGTVSDSYGSGDARKNYLQQMALNRGYNFQF